MFQDELISRKRPLKPSVALRQDPTITSIALNRGTFYMLDLLIFILETIYYMVLKKTLKSLQGFISL